MRDAVDGYRAAQRWRATLLRSAERAQACGLTEADVPRLIAEYREERRQGLHSA